jgi:hypothetical protein
LYHMLNIFMKKKTRVLLLFAYVFEDVVCCDLDCLLFTCSRCYGILCWRWFGNFSSEKESGKRKI